MSLPPDVSLDKLQSLIYAVKKFEFSKYLIRQDSINGILQIVNMPVDILKIDESVFQSNHVPLDEEKYAISYRGIVKFVNLGKRKTPTQAKLSQKNADNEEKIELGDHVMPKADHEPWNEYIIKDRPPRLLRVKSILVKAYVHPEKITRIGDPLIEVQHQTIISISDYDDADSE